MFVTTDRIRTAAAPPGYQPLARGAQNLSITPAHDSIMLTWDAPTSNNRDDWIVRIRHAEVTYPRTFWVHEPLRLTIEPLRPETTYTIEVLHMDRYRTVVSRTVTTTAAPPSGARVPFLGGPPGPLPEPPVTPTYSWPYAFSSEIWMTGDPWSWRTGGTKFHVGLDMAVRAGVVGDRRILAAAPGTLRVYFLPTDNYVVYCPNSVAELRSAVSRQFQQDIRYRFDRCQT